MNSAVQIGIDLAWSTNADTGIAVVDESGALLASASLRTDEGLIEWLHRASWAPVTVAIDAPLIVANASGQRPCERTISRAFGRYGASCHASNLAIRYFNPPRGATLAERLGWTMDPSHVGTVERPACIEVYPHPAMISMFNLPSVLPYKAKQGRPVDARRRAFSILMDHLEGLRTLALHSCARWSVLRALVDTARRQVDLERVEDEIDAIFCAYLAWLWRHDRSALRVYGDAVSGYIVAPPPPPTNPVDRPRGRATPSAAAFSVTFDVVGRPATFATGSEAAWRLSVRDAATAAMADRTPPASDTRVAVELTFRLGSPRTANEQWDLDNLVKPAIDALVPILGRRSYGGKPQVDDERVDEIHATKRTVRGGETPGVTITVRVLP